MLLLKANYFLLVLGIILFSAEKVVVTQFNENSLFYTPICGNLEIWASASRHRHWHRHWENFIFALLNVLWKIKHVYEIHSNILSCPSVTITHFYKISYHISTKIPSKHLGWSSLLIHLQALLSFSCYLEQLICGKQVNTCLCRNDSTGDFISGVLKTR